MFFIFKLLWYILTHATGSTKEQRSLQLQSWAECGTPAPETNASGQTPEPVFK